MTFSSESLNLFAVLLSQVSITPTADDFEEQARIMGQARRELLSALAALEPPASNRAQRRAKAKP